MDKERMRVEEILMRYGLALGNDLDLNHRPELFDALYQYYAFELGVMPYGTMKARTGDPYEWIEWRVNEL